MSQPSKHLGLTVGLLIFAGLALIGVIMALVVASQREHHLIGYEHYFIADVNDDKLKDLLLITDKTVYDGIPGSSPGRRVITLTARSGRDLKQLWQVELPRNLGDEYAGVLHPELVGDVLVQRWYTGVGFLHVKTREARFVEVEELLDESCLTERGIMIKVRHSSPMRFLIAEPATMTLAPVTDNLLCAHGASAEALSLKARCAALGPRCVEVIHAPAAPPRSPLQRAKLAQQHVRPGASQDRLVLRSEGYTVKVSGDALVVSDASGERWRRELGHKDTWAVAGSDVLLLTSDSRCTQCIVGGSTEQALRALRLKDGSERWVQRGDGPLGARYTFRALEVAGDHVIVRASRRKASSRRGVAGLLAVRREDGVLVEAP